MATFKVGICEPDCFSTNAIKTLSEKAEVFLLEGNNIKEFIKDKDAIFVRLKYLIDDALICDASKLKYICSPTTGLNHIKINNSNIQILSLKGEYDFLSNIRATPEHVFGLTLSLLRNYAFCFLNNDNKCWNRDLYRGYELYKNSVGIIGLGRIGKIIAKYFLAFGSSVYYYDIDDSKVLSGCCKCNSIEELIERANIVVLETNYTDSNCKMINRNMLLKMKDKYFVNAARGELVDENALIELINKKWFKGVAIDVIANETEKSNILQELIPLSNKYNLIITPHIGGATYSSMERTEEFITKKLINIAFKEEK